MSFSSPHLLIGERDPFMQRSLRRVFPPHFHLTFIENGPDLLQQAVAEAPDLILLEARLLEEEEEAA